MTAPPSAGTVLYDDACGFCRKWVPFWRGTLARRGFDIAPLQSRTAAELPGVSDETLLDDVRLLLPDGRHLAGAEVYRHVMRRIPWARPIAALASAPLLSRIFDRAYRAFADNRHRISRACAMPGPPREGPER